MMARKKLKKEGEADEERLQTVVAGRVSLNAVKIAKMLVAKAMEGHIGSIRMLLKLCEPRVLRNRPVKVETDAGDAVGRGGTMAGLDGR